uniref:Uncharacterized protein n=1 Tax=Ananas comosus var. bracteatus TaxID=296719 RepID=A0A6V7NEV7_ANACO|nr:unnamed protein product [Ananas comosus var. bracteatus]
MELREDLSFEEQPLRILAREVKRLRNREISYVKRAVYRYGSDGCTGTAIDFGRFSANPRLGLGVFVEGVPVRGPVYRYAVQILSKPSTQGEARDRGKGIASG